MRHIFQSVFKDGQGRIIPSATVSIYLAGTVTAANVYTAASGGSPVTSVTTASDGSFSFFVSDSDFSLNQRFKITMTKTDFATKSYDNITIFAPVPTGIYYPDANATDQGAATTGGYSLKDIIDAAGSNNITIKFRNSSGSATTSYTLTTSETIPSTCAIELEQGAMIVQGGSATLTINAPVVGNPMHQWLSGFAVGEVVFGAGSVESVYPEWMGIDGTADNIEIMLALSFAGKIPVKLLKRDYNTTGLITVTTGQTLVGCGDDSTYIKYTGSGIALQVLTGGARYNIEIADMSISNVTSGTVGLDVSTMGRSIIKNVSVDGFLTQQFLMGGSVYGNYFNKIYDLTTYNTLSTQIGIEIGGSYSANANQFFGGSFWGVDAQRGTGLKITNGNGNRFYGVHIASQANAVILTTAVRNLLDIYIEACDAQGTIASGCRGNIFYKYLDGSASQIVDSDGRNLFFGAVDGGDVLGGMNADGDLGINANAPVKLDTTGIKVGKTGTAGKVTLNRTSDGSGTCTITNNAGVLEVDASGSTTGDIKLIPGSSGKTGFFGSAGTTIPTITGSRGANAALADLLTKLAALGLLTDGTS